MPTMDYNVLIHKQLSGEISDGEARQLSAWLARDQANQEEFDKIKQIWLGAEEQEQEVNDEHFNREFEKLNRAVKDSILKEKIIRKYKKISQIKSAAIGLILIAGGYFFTRQEVKPEMSPAVFVANIGHQEVLLGNGVRVTLNDRTSLSFEESPISRTASLSGEALFEIAKDTRPFIVHTQSATVSVLGTSFLVKAYPDTPVEVYVISGSVKVTSGGEALILSAGEKSFLGVNQDQFFKSLNSEPNFYSWYTQKLEFNKTELRKILELIESLYRITFSVKNEAVLGCRFTGTFDHAKLENVLETLSFSMNVKFTSETGNYYKVSGKGCAP